MQTGSIKNSDLEDVNPRSFSAPLLHHLWNLLHVLYVPQPDSPVLQRGKSVWCQLRFVKQTGLRPSLESQYLGGRGHQLSVSTD